MPTYNVTRKSDNTLIYTYSADAPIEWGGMSFNDHIHAEFVEAEFIPVTFFNPSEWYINVGPFFDRFGIYKLPILASTDSVVQAVIKDATVRKYIDLKGRRTELVKAINLLQSKGFPLVVEEVLDVKPNIEEVFNGN